MKEKKSKRKKKKIPEAGGDGVSVVLGSVAALDSDIQEYGLAKLVYIAAMRGV